MDKHQSDQPKIKISEYWTFERIVQTKFLVQKYFLQEACFYSGLTLNQYGVASPCRTICTVCGFVALS